MGKQVTVLPGFSSVRGPSPKGYKPYQAGAVIVFTDAEYAALSNADKRALSSATTVADPVRPALDPTSRPVNVVSAATGTVALALGVNKLTLTGNVTVTFPTGVAVGNESEVAAYFIQDGTGSRTLTLPSAAKAAAADKPITLTVAANSVDFLAWRTTDAGATWVLVEKRMNIS